MSLQMFVVLVPEEAAACFGFCLNSVRFSECVERERPLGDAGV